MRHHGIRCPKDGLVINPEAGHARQVPSNIFKLHLGSMLWPLKSSYEHVFLPEEFRHQQLLEKMQRRKKRLGKKDEEDREEPSTKGLSFKHSKAEDKICTSRYGINQQGGG